MKKKNNILNWLIPVIVAIVLLFTYIKCKSDKKNNEREQIALVNALQDSLRVFKNKDSSQLATISVLQTESANTFTQINSRDQEIKDLQATVKDYQGRLKAGSSVTKAKIETLSETIQPTIITNTEYIKQDSLVYVYPTYRDTALDKKWIDYDVVMTKDSSKVIIKVNNDFDAIVGKDKKGSFVDVLVHNPYSTIRSVRTYQVSIPKPKKIGIGPNVSASIGNGFKIQITVGIGLQYNIIRF